MVNNLYSTVDRWRLASAMSGGSGAMMLSVTVPQRPAEVDGNDKVMMRLRDQSLHCKANGTIDVTMYGRGLAVVQLGQDLYKRVFEG